MCEVCHAGFADGHVTDMLRAKVVNGPALNCCTGGQGSRVKDACVTAFGGMVDNNPHAFHLLDNAAILVH